MTARKARPSRGDAVTPDMSIRDIAAAIGTSKAEIGRWKLRAAIPEAEFEARLSAHKAAGVLATTSSMIRSAPVPARGRVERAQGIVAAMTSDELVTFLYWIVSRVAS
jgi:hypothetical protein